MRDTIIKSARENPFVYSAFLLAALLYSTFFFYGHISWDDPEMVFRNRSVREFNLKQLLTGHYVGNYIPLTMLMHAADWAIFHAHDWGHHLVNLLFHLLNGLLVWRLGKMLFNNHIVSAAGVIIFLLHPLQVESVGWISELKNVLSTTFYLAGLIQYVKYLTGHEKRFYFYSFLLFLTGCLSKSSVVVFPLSLICIDLLVNRPVNRGMFINKIPFLIVSVVIGLINIYTQAADQFINHAHEFPYPERLGYAGYAIFKYTQLFLLPFNLSIIYPYPEQRHGMIAGYITLLALGSVITVLARKKQWQWLSLVLFILSNLILVLQFLPFGEVLFADRYLYVPVIGFAWLAGLVLARVKTSTVAFIILMAGYSVLCFSRIQVWRSAIHLYEDIIAKYPKQFVALNSAGVEKMFMNEDAGALAYFNRAISAAPRNYKGYYNRGLLYLKNNKPAKAIQSLNDALALYDYPKAVTARAAAYYHMGDIPKAINDARHAIESDTRNARAHFVLGNCYNDLNKLNEAIDEYDQSIAINPYEADFYFKRAIAYGKMQQFTQCLDDLNKCLGIDPNYFEAYYWKGVAKVNLKRDPCQDFAAAARHNHEPAQKAYEKYCR
jgi:protein O-mannosyl-transferase